MSDEEEIPDLVPAQIVKVPITIITGFLGMFCLCTVRSNVNLICHNDIYIHIDLILKYVKIWNWESVNSRPSYLYVSS